LRHAIPSTETRFAQSPGADALVIGETLQLFDKAHNRFARVAQSAE
jgi:hypothetical protein